MNNIEKILNYLAVISGIILTCIIILEKLIKNKKFKKLFLKLKKPFIPWTLLIVFLMIFGICGIFHKIPYARITSPIYVANQRVPQRLSIGVEYQNIPKTRYLWVIVRVPRVSPNWRIYPQLLIGGMPIKHLGNGYFNADVNLGGDNDHNEPFNIVILLVDFKTDKIFREYAMDCLNNENCGGIQLPDTGIEILDFNTVIRD